MNIQKEFNPVSGLPDVYRRLVENLHVGIYVTDAGGRLVYMNYAFAYILGYSSKDELIGLDLAEQLYVHPQERQLFLRKLAQVGFVRDYELQNKRKDGSVAVLSVTSNIIYDEHNQPAGVEGVVYDITEHKKLEKRIGLLEKAVEQTADHVMITDKTGVIQYVNPAFEFTTGYRREEVIGQTPKILKSGKQGIEYYQKLWATILSGETFYAQTTNRKKNGDLYVADQTISPVANESHEITHFVSIWKDITEKDRLDRLLKVEKKKLEEIIGFDEKITAIRKSDRLMDFVVSKAMSILEAEGCAIMFIEKERDELYTKASAGFGEKLEPIRIQIKESIAAQVIETGQSLLVKSTFPQSHHTSEGAFAAKSFMIAPIKRDGEVVGVITVADKKKQPGGSDSFDELDLKILCDIAREVAVAVENVKFYKELQFLTVTDPITNIHNFRHFTTSLDYEIKRIKRNPGDLALMMLDVDHFKSYNDEFGHPAGDHLLKDVAKILKDNVREADIVCRYAGDEFVLILPGTAKEGSVILAERIRRMIEKASFKKAVTVSVGLAHFKPLMTERELTVRADRALYRAKKEGRNKICSFM